MNTIEIIVEHDFRMFHLDRSVIHESVTPNHSIFQPVHLGESFTPAPRVANPSTTGHFDPLWHQLLPSPSKRKSSFLRCPAE
ncbi:hypothetical protein AVEN_35886-1, partial [Araneus ventricosus]